MVKVARRSKKKKRVNICTDYMDCDLSDICQKKYKGRDGCQKRKDFEANKLVLVDGILLSHGDERLGCKVIEEPEGGKQNARSEYYLKSEGADESG